MNSEIRNAERSIRVDIDRDRIKEVVSESYRMLQEYTDGDIHISKEEVMSQLERILLSGRISTRFFLNIPSDSMPDMLLRVDPIRRKVLARSKLKKRAAEINHFLKVL